MVGKLVLSKEEIHTKQIFLNKQLRENRLWLQQLEMSGVDAASSTRLSGQGRGNLETLHVQTHCRKSAGNRSQGPILHFHCHYILSTSLIFQFFISRVTEFISAQLI